MDLTNNRKFILNESEVLEYFENRHNFAIPPEVCIKCDKNLYARPLEDIPTRCHLKIGGWDLYDATIHSTSAITDNNGYYTWYISRYLLKGNIKWIKRKRGLEKILK